MARFNFNFQLEPFAPGVKIGRGEITNPIILKKEPSPGVCTLFLTFLFFMNMFFSKPRKSKDFHQNKTLKFKLTSFKKGLKLRRVEILTFPKK